MKFAFFFVVLVSLNASAVSNIFESSFQSSPIRSDDRSAVCAQSSELGNQAYAGAEQAAVLNCQVAGYKNCDVIKSEYKWTQTANTSWKNCLVHVVVEGSN